jgi:predicted nuclease of restriction endonuclease-like RecB superfamily
VLTADLVRVRKKGTELTVSELSPKQRPRALELAESYLGLAQAAIGASRAELDEAFAALQVAASEQKLALGLRKLVEDCIEFDVVSEVDPRVLRSEVFEAAARARRELGDGDSWDREAFLTREASARGVPVESLMRTLYADLKGAQVLLGMRAVTAQQLVDGYDLAQKQAVLLRAVDLIADVRCRDAYAYRELFRKLKFFRLMHRIEAHVDGGYRIFIDGPFTLFSASTKYGLSLALALPALLACDVYRIRANLRWGKERAPLTFELEGKCKGARTDEEARLPDEVQAFVSRFRALGSAWEVSASSDILELPGQGLCVPDLRFMQRDTGEVAYLEVLGFWSREAVWRRVELVSAGLTQRVLFAVSTRLRVSEEVLGDELPGRLYVYKGTLSAKEVLRRLDLEPAGALAGDNAASKPARGGFGDSSSDGRGLVLPLPLGEG